jgi:hypothetical protein
VPKFDSWRGHLRKRGLDGAAAKPPRLQVGIASDADARAQVQFLPGAPIHPGFAAGASIACFLVADLKRGYTNEDSAKLAVEHCV